MPTDRFPAVVIILGSVLFMAAAFSPVSRVFGTPGRAEKLAIIEASGAGWMTAQVLFAVGALVTAAGIWLLAARAAAPASAALAWSAGVMTAGAILWSGHVYLRAVDPARFVAGEIPLWLFVGYSLLTLAGLAVLGLAALQMGLPPWLGWLCIAGAGVLLVLGITFGDMPPFVYYLITLTLGIVLLRTTAHGLALPGAG